MKLKVFDHEEPENDVVRIKIKERCNRIAIYAVYADGNPVLGGDIAFITPDGITRCSSLSDDLGFPLDRFDRINLNE